jgi:hypothetical protein
MSSVLYKLSPVFAFCLNPRFLFFLSIAISVYLVFKNNETADILRLQYEGMDIQGAFIDPDIHQVNFFVWSGLNQVKRKTQGLSSVETWSVDFSRQRFVINASIGTVSANYAERAGNTLLIKNPIGTILKRLDLVTPFDCLACKDASVSHPTYSNFAQNYTLARVVESERDQFAADLDRFRACAIYNLQSLPVGINSNNLLAGSALALSKGENCFYYVPPTQLGILLSNGVLEVSVTYNQIPYAFCGSM